MTVKNSGGTTLKTYGYDGLNRRVSETASGAMTDLYYSSNWQVLEERVAGATTASYVWSPTYVDAMIARDRDTDANGSLDERLYVAHDANFNVTALVNTSGTVVERYVYDSYGAATVMNSSWTVLSGSAYGWQYLFQGGRLDAISGLDYFRMRDYSMTLGRWTTNDPKRFGAGDVDLYRYVGNNSLVYSDPSGLGRIGRIAGGIIGIAIGIGPVIGANIGDNLEPIAIGVMLRVWLANEAVVDNASEIGMATLGGILSGGLSGGSNAGAIVGAIKGPLTPDHIKAIVLGILYGAIAGGVTAFTVTAGDVYFNTLFSGNKKTIAPGAGFRTGVTVGSFAGAIGGGAAAIQVLWGK